MTVEEYSAPAAPAPEPPATNSFSRMAGALVAPARTFVEIARRPDIVWPLLVIILVGYVSTAITLPKLDWSSIHEQQAEQMRKRTPNVAQADLDRMQRISESIGTATAWVMPLLLVAWYALIAGALLVAFRLMGGEGNYKQAFSATLYAWMPMIVLTVAGTIVIMIRGSFDALEAGTLVKSNPSFLVDIKEQPVLASFLSSFDIFTFWTLALLTFGFSALSKLSRARSAVIVAVMYVVLVVIKVGFSALGALMSSAV